MKQSSNRILTTHVGSLPRPANLIELYRDQAPPEKLESTLTSAVADVVARQIEAGIDVVNDGEFGKPMSDEVDYGAWATYVYHRVTGFEMRDLPKDFSLLNSFMGGSKDRRDFAEYYGTPEAYAGPSSRPLRFPINVGPIRYTGHEAIQRDIRNLKAALVDKNPEDAFMTAVATGVNILPGEYYKSADEQATAVVEAMRNEYKAITDAGINLQLDDPIIVNVYEWQYSMNGDMAAFRKVGRVARGIGESCSCRHTGRENALSHLLGQLERPAQHRPSVEKCAGSHAEGESEPILRRGCESTARARMEGLEKRQTPRGQSGDSRSRESQDECARASGGGG